MNRKEPDKRLCWQDCVIAAMPAQQRTCVRATSVSGDERMRTNETGMTDERC